MKKNASESSVCLSILISLSSALRNNYFRFDKSTCVNKVKIDYELIKLNEILTQTLM